jgi:hypothetical protein
MELQPVKIVENDGVPVRVSLKFATGTLMPGEVLAIPMSQAKRAASQGEVEMVSPDDVIAAPVVKKKSKAKPAKPAVDPLS